MATVPPPIVVKTASPQDFALVTAMRQTRISHNFEDQDVSNHRGLSYQLSKLTKWNSSQPIVLWPLGIGLRSRDRWFTLGARGSVASVWYTPLSFFSITRWTKWLEREFTDRKAWATWQYPSARAAWRLGTERVLQLNDSFFLSQESTHTRVLYLSVLSMLILVSFAVWQVLYLRRYFKLKYPTSTLALNRWSIFGVSLSRPEDELPIKRIVRLTSSPIIGSIKLESYVSTMRLGRISTCYGAESTCF
ncbi:hypothetical protein T265_05603 [Opisthorchis viverrini]|uniref:GOLD domain-containing protein n=1 Tax=Opisthorchis viverrini TaxID=6198 RepID=A0A075AF48_OPIVI|nr:hypothetical protein T265_05603 [Opisthorchis viverrini]KER27359.1 hypothetical protein T265_05603 [Opisthorchis viverrini]